MKNLFSLIIALFYLSIGFTQSHKIIENKATLFTINHRKSSIDFIIAGTIQNQKKPIFLWCQGSGPIPLFIELDNEKNYFLGGGISNFNYLAISERYNLVVISMPNIPIIGHKQNLNNQYHFVKDNTIPNNYLPEYLEADYLENYTERATAVLNYLLKQPWVSKGTLIVAGHSQGAKVATQIAKVNKKVSHLGLFGYNPLGRIDQQIRQAQYDAQMGKISLEKADSLITESYDFYIAINDVTKHDKNPVLRTWKSFSKNTTSDILSLDIPIYLAYGTEDRTSDLCDLLPLQFIEKGKTNLSQKRYNRLEHNFFELKENGRLDHQKGHWPEVMKSFTNWIK